MPQERRTQSLLAMTRDKGPFRRRAKPDGELRAYRWFRRVNRAILAVGTTASGVLAIEGHGLGVATILVSMMMVLAFGFSIELGLRPPGGDKPTSGRQVAIDRKAAARPDTVYQRACSEIRWTGEALIIFDSRGRSRST